MQRVQSISIADTALDPDRKYTLATRAYMAHGKDGFHSLLMASEGGAAEEIVEEENGMLISALLRQYFMSLKVMGRWKGWGKGMSRVWGTVHDDLHQTHPVRGGKVSSPQISAHLNQNDATSLARAGEVQERKEIESKELVGGLGAAAHGGDQHQGPTSSAMLRSNLRVLLALHLPLIIHTIATMMMTTPQQISLSSHLHTCPMMSD
jgi:hypothetical protein